MTKHQIDDDYEYFKAQVADQRRRRAEGRPSWFLTPKEVAKTTRRSWGTVRKWVNTGQLDTIPSPYTDSETVIHMYALASAAIELRQRRSVDGHRKPRRLTPEEADAVAEETP